MIKGFSGKTHEVLSVLYLMFRHGNPSSFKYSLIFPWKEDDSGETVLTSSEVSKVTFGEIPEKSIEIYSKIEDIRKVSGGYRIIDSGLNFISSFEGTRKNDAWF